MTAPQPPSVPAPPPAHTILVGQAPATPKTPSPAKAAKTPIVGRPRRPLPPGPVIAAAGTTAAGVGTASWLGAVALGASGPVGLGVAAVAAPAGYVAYRKLRRPPAARKALARTRPAGQGTAGRPSPLAWLRGRRGQQAAGGASAPQRTPGGPTPARRKGLRGLLPGGQRRSPGSGGAAGRTAAGSPSGGRSPGRPGGSGRVARFMPGARGRAARAAGGSQRPGSGQGGTTAAGQRRRFGLDRRNGPASRTTPAKAAPAKATGTGTAPSAGGSAPRTRAGRAWARRPGGARRAQAAASRSTLTPTKRGGSTPATPAKTTGPAGPSSTRGSGRGVKAMLGRGAQARRAAGKTTPAKAPAKTVPAKTTAGTPVVPAKTTGGGPAVWSTRRKHRRTPAGPALAAAGATPACPGRGAPVSPRTGKPRRRWNPNLRFGKSGSTKHTPQPPPSGKGGGVGPVPKPAGPKPAGPGGAPVVTNPADPAKTAASARKDAETTAAEWDASARKFADAGKPKAALAAAARAAQARAEAERNGAPKTATPIPGGQPRPAPRPSRRSELADSQWGPGGLRDNPPPQTDHSWAKGFQPGPEPLSADARTAARDRWQRRTTGGTGMSGHEDINARTAKRALDDAGRQGWANRLPSSGGSGHAGRGDINGMSEFPGLMRSGGTMMGEAADHIERIAAITDDTPSNQAVKEAARTWAQQARALAAQGDEIAVLSERADANGHGFRDQYGRDPNWNMWGS